MSYGQKMVEAAAHFVGTMEHPPGSNSGPHIDGWLLGCGISPRLPPSSKYWCCAFLDGMLKLAGWPLHLGASVAGVVDRARRGVDHLHVVTRPRRGDLLCYEFSGDGRNDDHIGAVERVLALRWKGGAFVGWVRTIEGNTSAQADRYGSQSNGGGVFRRWRWIKSGEAVIVRIDGP